MNIKAKMILNGIYVVLKAIDPADLEKLADKMLDWVEERYAENKAIMGGCALIRTAFSIEDND